MKPTQGSPADSPAASLAVILDGMRQRDEGAPFGERDPQDVPRLLAAVEAVLKLAGFFAAKATELDGMANRASLRGADPIRTTLLSARAQAHEDCSKMLHEAISAALGAGQ